MKLVVFNEYYPVIIALNFFKIHNLKKKTFQDYQTPGHIVKIFCIDSNILYI